MAKASIYFDLDSVDGKHGVSEIKKRLDSIPGVFSVSVSRESGRVAIDYDTSGTNPDKIQNKLSECDFGVVDRHSEEHIM